MKKKRFLLISLSVFAGACLLLFLERSSLLGIAEKPAYKGFNLLESVVRLIKSDYIEERDPAKTMEGAFKGLVDSLDPLSSYFNRETTSKYLQRHMRWADIGVVFAKNSFGLFPQVAGIIENSPAEKSGLKVGDYISAIDGKETLSMSLMESSLYLKDLEQKPVALRILRDNETMEVKTERQVLYSDPCVLSAAGPYAVLKINHLYSPCVDRIKKKMIPLLKSQKEPLVLDLRNCSEGDIEEARSFLNVFIKASHAGYFEKRGGSKETLACPADPGLKSPPKAIWVNQGTMGPAELVAGVLQEAQKVKVIGSATPGLVCKQDLYTLQDGSSILLTSGIFFLDSGKKLWAEGVAPDEKLDAGDLSTGAYLKRTAALSIRR